MRKAKIFALINMVLLVITFLSFNDFTVEAEDDGHWWIEWHDQEYYYAGTLDLNLSTTVSIYAGGHYWADAALIVSITEYHTYTALYDDVVFKVYLYWDSFADEGYTPVPADYVDFYVDKDSNGSNLYDQSISLEVSATPPGFSQGNLLSQHIYTISSVEDRTYWAFKAAAFAVGLFFEPVDIAMDLIELAQAWLPDGGRDFQDAGWYDMHAEVWWHRPLEYDVSDLNPLRQYCFNSIRWFQQESVNPSDYYGIDISARLALPAYNPFGDYIYLPPISLRLYHSYPNSPPNIPSAPAGHSSGYRGVSYSYTTCTTDPNGDQVQYDFYWDDGTHTTTIWRDSGVLSGAYHTWSAAGVYNIRVRAQDRRGAWSDYSPNFTVTIRNPPGGGGGCPTLFIWNGSAYNDFGVIDIHNPENYDLIEEVPLSPRIVYINNYQAKIRLREGWEGLNYSHSEIDQVKLYAVINGTRYLCPLICASHSQTGNVLLPLLFSDNWKTDAYLLETINLRFLVPYQNVDQYIFHIEGRNPYKR